MRIEVNGNTGLSKTILTLGCGDGTDVVEVPLEYIIDTLRNSDIKLKRKLSTLAEDRNGTVDKEISADMPRQVIGDMEISGNYAVRWTKTNSEMKLGHGVTVPNDPRDGWDKYKSRTCTGGLYITKFDGKKVLYGNTVELERLTDSEIMSIAAI